MLNTNMLLTVILAVLVLLESYIGIEMVNSPPITNKLKWIYRTAFFVIGFGIILLTVVQYHEADQKDSQNAASINGLTNQLAQLKQEETDQFRQLTMEFSTNVEINPNVRKAVLQDELEKNLIIGSNILNQRVVLEAQPQSLENLRKERENLAAQKESESRTQTLQSEIDALNNQKQADLDAEKARQDQEIIVRDDLRIVRKTSDQVLSVYNSVIAHLYKMISKITSDPDVKIMSTFQDDPPTIYSSHLVKDGLLAKGDESIKLGTNQDWEFNFKTEGRLQVSPRIQMTVTSGHENAQSTLTVVPDLTTFDAVWMPTQQRANAIRFMGDAYRNNNWNKLCQVSIKLEVPGGETNGLNFNESASPTNYSGVLDKALRHLIEAQDQQCPISNQN